MNENLNRPAESATDVERELAYATHRARRSVRARTAAGAALLLLLTAWGTWLHAQVKSFEAADAATVARIQVAAALPKASAALAERLREAAPDLLARAKRELLRAPAFVRARIEPAVYAELPPMAASLERELKEEVRESIRLARASLNERFPESNDRERFDRLVEEFVGGYRARLSRVTAAYASPYRSSLEGLRRHLDRLAEADGLGEKERVERDILVTFLELYARAKERGETTVLSGGGWRLPFLRDE